MSLTFGPLLTMEGMIQRADSVLDRVTRNDRDGAVRRLFESCRGLILISVVEGAVVLSGAAGVGVMFVKDPDETWSPPCACGMASTSWGFSVGAVIRDVIIFALDDKSVREFTTKLGLKLGVGTSVTLGTVGTNVGANVNLSTTGTSGTINVHNTGVGGTVSIAFCQGAYVSASLSGAMVGPRDMVNQAFYEEPVSADEILFGHVDIPRQKLSPVLGDVYDKLDMLSEGSNGAFIPKASASLLSGNFLSAVSVIMQQVTDEVLKTLEEQEKTNAIALKGGKEDEEKSQSYHDEGEETKSSCSTEGYESSREELEHELEQSSREGLELEHKLEQ